MEHIRKCTINEMNLDLHSLWSKSWGLEFCKETMTRNRFCEIMSFLRFDLKSTRSARPKTDKFFSNLRSVEWVH